MIASNHKAILATLNKAFLVFLILALAVVASSLIPFSKSETPAAAIKQKDGSLVLERKPDAQAKPVHEIPKGAVVERIAKVVVKPRKQPSETSSGQSDATTPDCPPVSVDLSLVRLQDDSRRVVVSSPDGEVISGIDIPVQPLKLPAPDLKWAAGISYSSDRRGGAWIDRDIGRLRVGLEVRESDSGLHAQLKAGIRF